MKASLSLLALLAALAAVAPAATAATTRSRRLLVPAPESTSSPDNGSALVTASSGPPEAAAPMPGSATYTGDGTAYSEAVANSGQGFACSLRYLNDWASVHFAAINAKQWDNGAACGRGITVKCTDSRCKNHAPVSVVVVDLCPECKEGDLDFSIPVYRQITGLWPHRLSVEWSWADVSSFQTGNIMAQMKDGSNDFWQALYFANSKYPLANVSLDGTPLARQQFNFYEHRAPLSSGATHELTFTATNGKVATVEVDKDTLLSPTLRDLKIQFDP